MILGLVLLYFMGKKFYDLADKYDKHKWGFAILGIVTYYATTILIGLILGVFELLFETNFLENTNETVLGLIFLPFGILGCYLLYIFLEKKWEREKPQTNTMIDSIGDNKQY